MGTRVTRAAPHFPVFAYGESGELATASEIKRAFEVRVGHEVEKSSFLSSLIPRLMRSLTNSAQGSLNWKKSPNS